VHLVGFIIGIYHYTWSAERQILFGVKILIIILDALLSQISFWNKTLNISDSSSVHHQELFYCTHRFADSLRAVSCLEEQATS